MYVTRICWNTQGWQRPSGNAKSLETGKTFSRMNGFGHEEWLFRKGWELGGWRYGFLQGINVASDTYRNQSPLNVALYSVDPSKQKRLVGEIRGLEVLSEQEAADALAAFSEYGWLATMQQEIEAKQGNADLLRTVQDGREVFNVRYRPENAIYFDDLPPLMASYVTPNSTRYQMHKLPGSLLGDLGLSTHQRGRAESTANLCTAPTQRKASSAVTVDPVHNRMQLRLVEALKVEHPGKTVSREKNYVDVTVEDETTIWIYEIKSDLTPRSVLRNAIGQLLEYAYYGTSRTKRVVLTAVGRRTLETDVEAKEFLDSLKAQFNLEINYRDISGD